RLEWYPEALGYSIERQPDLELLLGDDQIPELVLQNDRHLLRILLAQARRYPHAGRARVERDVEMVLAREPILGRVAQHALHDAAQRLVGQEIVADMVGGHEDGLDRTL